MIKYSFLSIANINARIKNEICYKTLEKLSDENLMFYYKNSKSFKKKSKFLENILEKYTDNHTKNKILQEYILELIPPGTKAVIRGMTFNDVVKNFILSKIQLDKNRFEIHFEKKCNNYHLEIPDWYILEKETNKIIIGMNQLDLWSGGQQLNRATKYILDNKYDNKTSKLLCVICNEIQIKTKKNKIYKLFEIGFENNTLCYLNNLQHIITSFFN